MSSAFDFASFCCPNSFKSLSSLFILGAWLEIHLASIIALPTKAHGGLFSGLMWCGGPFYFREESARNALCGYILFTFGAQATAPPI